MVYIVMAYIVMAYVVVAYTVMALYSYACRLSVAVSSKMRRMISAWHALLLSSLRYIQYSGSIWLCHT